MADFIKNPVVTLPDQDPAPVIPSDQLTFTTEEKALIKRYVNQYATPQGAVMKALWLAQEKFGWLPPEVIRLVADELEIPYSVAYGVATFYSQYYKEEVGKFVLDVCTCFSCQFCGGYDILHYLEDKLGIHKGETTPDGMFTLQEVECLGACGSAPMMQITNGPYMHNLTPAKIDDLIDNLRAGQLPVFTSVTLPQDETEMGGNRRSDTPYAEPYVTPPVSETVR
jgi:NADH-quinone oxidoreductase subunit E